MKLLSTNKSFYQGASLLFLFYALLHIIYTAAMAVVGATQLPAILPIIIYFICAVGFLAAAIMVKDKLPVIKLPFMIVVMVLWFLSICASEVANEIYFKSLSAGRNHADFHRTHIIYANIIYIVCNLIIAAGIIVLLVKYYAFRRKERRGDALTPTESVIGYALWGALCAEILLRGESVVHKAAELFLNWPQAGAVVNITMVALYCAGSMVVVILAVVFRKAPQAKVAVFLVLFLLAPVIMIVRNVVIPTRIGIFDNTSMIMTEVARYLTYGAASLWQMAVCVIVYWQYRKLSRKESVVKNY